MQFANKLNKYTILYASVLILTAFVSHASHAMMQQEEMPLLISDEEVPKLMPKGEDTVPMDIEAKKKRARRRRSKKKRQNTIENKKGTNEQSQQDGEKEFKEEVQTQGPTKRERMDVTIQPPSSLEQFHEMGVNRDEINPAGQPSEVDFSKMFAALSLGETDLSKMFTSQPSEGTDLSKMFVSPSLDSLSKSTPDPSKGITPKDLLMLVQVPSLKGGITFIHLVSFPHDPVTNDTLYMLGSFPKLQKLYLKECDQITDAGLQYLPTSLTELNLNYSSITGRGLEHIGKQCPHLTKLHLGNTKITGNSLQHIVRKCPHLTKLYLGNADITDISSLANLHKLTKLNLEGCDKLKDNGLQGLPKELTKLSLSNANITSKGLQHIIRKCPHLTRLDLSYTNITDIGLLANLRKLTRLNLEECSGLIDESLKSLPNSLVILNLCNTNITDTSFLARLNKLTTLYLFNCAKIQDECLEYLPQNLKHLDLNGCTEISDTGLKHIAAKCLELTSLDLTSCEKVTDIGVQHLLRLKQLKKLDLSECDKVTSGKLKKLHAALPNLEIYTLISY